MEMIAEDKLGRKKILKARKRTSIILEKEISDAMDNIAADDPTLTHTFIINRAVRKWITRYRESEGKEL